METVDNWQILGEYDIEADLRKFMADLQFCNHKKEGSPNVEIKHNVFMATVTQICNHCGKNQQFEWRSQPFIFGRYPAGNIMSFGILLFGVHITQVLLMFRHMGFLTTSAHSAQQQKFLFQSVFLHWEKYHANLTEKLQGVKDPFGCHIWLDLNSSVLGSTIH